MLDKGQSAHERGNDSSMEELKYLALVQYVINQTYSRWIKIKEEQSWWKTEALKFMVEKGLLKYIEKRTGNAPYAVQKIIADITTIPYVKKFIPRIEHIK